MNGKKKLFIEAFKKNGLNISRACQIAEISRRTYYYWIDNDEGFKQAVNYAKEELIDLAESKLIEKIHAGDLNACIFFLRTKGKHRGYDTKTLINSSQKQIIFTFE